MPVCRGWGSPPIQRGCPSIILLVRVLACAFFSFCFFRGGNQRHLPLPTLRGRRCRSLSGLACRISTQFRNEFALLPLNQAGFSIIDHCGLDDFRLAGRFTHVATGVIVVRFRRFGLSFQVSGRYAAMYRAFFFSVCSRYATRDAYQIYRRQVLGLASAFEDVVPDFVCRIQIDACQMSFCTRYFRLIMLFDRVRRFDEACRDGINEVRRRGHPFAFRFVINCDLRDSILGDLGARFEGLEVWG